jgi:hypothetical protein
MEMHSNQPEMIVMMTLNLIPPSIREALLADPTFQERNGIMADALLFFGNGGPSIRQSTLFNGIREILADNSSEPSIMDEDGIEWQLTCAKVNDEIRIELLHRNKQLLLHDAANLSPNQTERLKCFKRQANNVNFPTRETEIWRTILEVRPLENNEFNLLHADFELTPTQMMVKVEELIVAKTLNFSALVPNSEQYFLRLIGTLQESNNITEYASTELAAHINQLTSWRGYEGFLLALMLASHSYNLAAIDTSDLSENDLIRAYEWLQHHGDVISQLGAVEVGLALIDQHPKIEPYLINIISQIRDENVDDGGHRFKLLSALIIFVDAELTRTKILCGKPPFWRRLAAITHASLIERVIIQFEIDVNRFTNLAIQTRQHAFQFQTLCDLRREPRWHPEDVLPRQLKAEFLGRILGAANCHLQEIESNELRELALKIASENLQIGSAFPYFTMPGPLEGCIGSKNEPPPDILKCIEAQLCEGALQLESFTTLVNAVLIFQLDTSQADLAVKALRNAKYHINHIENKDKLLPILHGLAKVAAVTRNSELADDLRILARKYRHQSGCIITAEEAMLIGMVAAAAHSGLGDWCKFVGEWITELAFQSLPKDELETLQFHVKMLCNIVPELWHTCGRADAALEAALGALA